MSWDIRLKRPDGAPLGNQTAVQETIALACPGVAFYREPSGAEKLASVPNLEFPDVIRRHMESAPAQRQGDLEAPDFSLRFFLGDEGADLVAVVDIEARGTTEHALPTLSKLTASTGWIVVDGWGNIVAGSESGHAR